MINASLIDSTSAESLWAPTLTTYIAKRAGIAILTGPQYQASLLDSLNNIKTCCSALDIQARRSFEYRMMGGENLAGHQDKEHYVLIAQQTMTACSSRTLP